MLTPRYTMPPPTLRTVKQYDELYPPSPPQTTPTPPTQQPKPPPPLPDLGYKLSCPVGENSIFPTQGLKSPNAKTCENFKTHKGSQNGKLLHGSNMYKTKARSLVENTHSGANHWLRQRKQEQSRRTHTWRPSVTKNDYHIFLQPQARLGLVTK